MSFTNSSKILRVLSSPNLIGVNSSCYSTYSQRAQPYIIYADKDKKDRRNTLLGPNKKFPFPGDVMCAATSSKTPLNQAVGIKSSKKKGDQNTSNSLQFERTKVAETPFYASLTPKELVRKLLYQISRSENYKPLPIVEDIKCNRKVELKVTECPKLLKMDLKNLFADVDLSNRELTVLNITQKMSEDIGEKAVTAERLTMLESELERIQLSTIFVEAATAICEGLQLFGYWADFIDPRSGRPFNGKLPRTSSLILEFDNRYLQLGFAIKNIGMCKVVQNVYWGKDSFVGTIFTDAPLNSEIVEKIIGEIN